MSKGPRVQMYCLKHPQTFTQEGILQHGEENNHLEVMFIASYVIFIQLPSNIAPYALHLPCIRQSPFLCTLLQQEGISPEICNLEVG